MMKKRGKRGLGFLKELGRGKSKFDGISLNKYNSLFHVIDNKIFYLNVFSYFYRLQNFSKKCIYFLNFFIKNPRPKNI